jgi:LytTr DNA-binding domain
VTIKLNDESPVHRTPQPAGDEWVHGRDGRPPAVTNGGLWGTSGERVRVPLAAYVGFGLFVLAVNTVNALSKLHDLDVLGARVAAWKPFVAEYSSGAMILALAPMVVLLLMIAPPGHGKWGRFALVHGLGTVAYSLIHVGGFVLLRQLAFAALEESYRFGTLGDLFYEYRKDVLTYFIALTFFALAARLAASRTPAPVPSPGPAAPGAIFDIRDGGKVIRARTSDIAAAMAAGNYVEFHMVDGRRPLMRTTLASVEAELAPHGFVRTHRSWLVNAACVRELKAEGGSGDHRLELEGRVEAPLSRRFPQALDRLRRPA